MGTVVTSKGAIPNQHLTGDSQCGTIHRMEWQSKEKGMPPRLALVFPPAMHPTSPPLGVACLKPFLTETAEQPTVRIFDLNLAHYDQALVWLADGRLRVHLKNRDWQATAEKVRSAVRFLRGEFGLEAFLDMAAYNEHASVYRSFERVVNGFFEYACRRLLVGLTVPALVEQYFQELLEPVRSFSPELVGLSILFSQQLYFALALARYVKEWRAAVAVGGATVSVMPKPEMLLADSISTAIGNDRHELHPHRFIDYVVPGEGERALAALVRNLHGDPGSVPGLWYRHNGSVKHNSPEVEEDVNRLPLPDFDDLALADYHSPLPMLPYLSSRGCPWGRCSFCSHHRTYHRYREEDTDKTVTGLAALQARYGVSVFSLVDEMVRPRRFERLGEALGKCDLELHYSAYAKPTWGFNRALLDTLHRSGARLLLWGVESGNQRVLDAMNKGTRVEEMARVLWDSRDAGIWNLVFVMFGFPGETTDEWHDTLEFLHRHRDTIDGLSKSRFVLVAGSEIHRRPARFGISEIIQPRERELMSVAHGYRLISGHSPEEAAERYREHLPKLEAYGRSRHLSVLREHLLVYAVHDKR